MPFILFPLNALRLALCGVSRAHAFGALPTGCVVELGLRLARFPGSSLGSCLPLPDAWSRSAPSASSLSHSLSAAAAARRAAERAEPKALPPKPRNLLPRFPSGLRFQSRSRTRERRRPLAYRSQLWSLTTAALALSAPSSSPDESSVDITRARRRALRYRSDTFRRPLRCDRYTTQKTWLAGSPPSRVRVSSHAAGSWMGRRPQRQETPHDLAVPRIMLSDIGSGATRLVTARWTHTLHKHIVEKQPPGTIVTLLREADYTAHFDWPHALILGAFLLQLAAVPVAMAFGQRSEGLLLLGIPAIPGPARRLASRYCTLHTGMTTTTSSSSHTAKVTAGHASCSKTPRRKGGGGRPRLLRAQGRCMAAKGRGPRHHRQRLCDHCRPALRHGRHRVGRLHIRYAAPAGSHRARARNEKPLLDRLTAACQFTEWVSVGFVESLLPDRRGNHTDYVWISHAMQQGMAVR
ncbi:hypothetical protein GGX14DRAFT_667487 [Mycena pura]|uniref:Uncharacterized protein n=1 Tax=Mycena pura TaxID=153505 RepID=A0AAD6V5G8_9AGAR|nr:hypothetical protein GGX14DRAFT_667487 [Mycena pura]